MGGCPTHGHTARQLGFQPGKTTGGVTGTKSADGGIIAGCQNKIFKLELQENKRKNKTRPVSSNPNQKSKMSAKAKTEKKLYFRHIDLKFSMLVA